MAVVDDFSDGDLSEYQQDGSASISGGRLEVQNTDKSGRSEYCTSLSGLPTYPQQGDTITLEAGANNANDVISSFQFAVQSHGPFPECFELSYFSYNDSLDLRYREDSNTTTPIASVSFSTTNEELAPVTIEWGGGGGSSFVFEEGTAVTTGSQGQHDFVYANGNPVADDGDSSLTFESGTGISLGATPEFILSADGNSDSGGAPNGAPASGGIGFTVGTDSGETARYALFDNVEVTT